MALVGRSFLDLPPELRQLVYQLALPVRRLCTHKLLDHEFLIAAPERRALPALLFASRQVYAEASEVLYSRAILELAPAQPPHFMFGTLNDAPMSTLDLSFDLDQQFSFLPRRLLRVIERVHVFSDQRTAINAEAYECTLKWLLLNTNVQEIRLSSRLMCRLRKSRVGLARPDDFPCPKKLARAIHVYTHARRSEWEITKRREARKALNPVAVPELQMYAFFQTEAGPYLQFDPRWDARSSDDGTRSAEMEALAACFDRLTFDMPSYRDEPILSRYRFKDETGATGTDSGPREWLYQAIFVFN